MTGWWILQQVEMVEWVDRQHNKLFVLCLGHWFFLHFLFISLLITNYHDILRYWLKMTDSKLGKATRARNAHVTKDDTKHGMMHLRYFRVLYYYVDVIRVVSSPTGLNKLGLGSVWDNLNHWTGCIGSDLQSLAFWNKYEQYIMKHHNKILQ